MTSRLPILLLGVLVGSFMLLTNHVQAQEIGLGAPLDTGTPTIGTASTGTSNARPPLPPPPPPDTASALFAPGLPFGGGVSQSGESLAQLLEQQAANQTYNMKVGPIQLRAEAEINSTFNDNIGLSQHDRISDLIVTPMATLHGNWQLSKLNAINFDIGLGYQAYLLHPKYDCVVIAPDSSLSFNFFLGEVALNLHDIFSYSQDPTQYGQVSNQVRLSSFNNDAGVSATWDFGDVTLELDYDHANLWVLDSIYDYLTNQSDTFAPTLTYKIDETISAGVNGSVSSTRYEQSFQNNNVSETVGPFVKATLSNNLSATAAAGGFFTQYATGGGNGDTTSNIASYYGNFGITHRINDVLTESLTAGKGYIPGLTSDYTEQLYVTYGDTWSANQNITFGSNLFWQNFSDSEAITRENSNRYGLSLSMGDNLARNLDLTLSYQFLLKESTPSYLSYTQNQATVGLDYNF